MPALHAWIQTLMHDPQDRTTPEHTAPPPSAPPIGTRGMVIGTVLLGLLLLGFAFWADAASRRVAAPGQAVPDLLLVSPVEGAVVGGAVELVFETGADLRRGPGGWHSGRYHLHAMVDGVEVMPGAGDIARVEGRRHVWRLGALAPGTRELRLFWSDERHREVEGSGSPAVRVEAR